MMGAPHHRGLSLAISFVLLCSGCHGPRTVETPATGGNTARVNDTPANDLPPRIDREQAARASAGPPEIPLLGTARPALGKAAQAACVEPVSEAAKLIEKGSLPEARTLLEEALSECPGYSAAHYDLAVIAAREGEHAEASRRLLKAITANYLRYAALTMEDPELEGLRESDHWPEARQRIQLLRGAWAKALSEPGAWVIFGHDAPMSMVYAGAPDAHQSWRGQLFYFHLPSKRFLPIGRSRQVSGFLVDSAARRIHFAEIKRVVNLDCISDDGGWCFQEIRGARISSLSLEDLTLTGPAKLPHRIVSPSSMKIAEGYPWPAITSCEDRLLARYFLPPDPPRDVHVAELAGSTTKALGVSTFDEQGCTGAVLPLTPFRLARTHETSLRRTCLQLTPQHQLCSDREASPVGLNAQSDALRVLLRQAGSEQVLSEDAAVVQMETDVHVSPAAVGEPRRSGLTCENLGTPVRVAKIAATGALSVAASGSYLFIASRWWHIDVYDVSEAENPSFVGRIPVPGRAYNVHVAGRYLIVGDGNGIHSLDVANPLVGNGFPDSPRLSKSVEFRYMGRRGAGSLLAVHGDHGYVIGSKNEDYDGDVHIIDLRDPASPSAIGKIPDTHGAERLRVVDGRLYVAGRTVDGYELGDPLAPKLVGRRGRLPVCSFTFGDSEIRLVSRRLETYDVSEPDEPTKIGSLSLGGQLGDFAVEGRHAFVPAGPQGVHVVRLCEQ